MKNTDTSSKFENLLASIMVAPMILIVVVPVLIGMFLGNRFPSMILEMMTKGYLATVVYIFGYWLVCFLFWKKLRKRWLHVIVLIISFVYFCFSFLVWGVSTTPQVIYDDAPEYHSAGSDEAKKK